MATSKRPMVADTSEVSYASKIFVRSTKAGKVQKVVREIYLRQDISCGSKLCSECTAANLGGGQTNRLQKPLLSITPLRVEPFVKGHYIIPDTNAFLNAIDLFESDSAMHDVIVLQTVLEEVKHRSLPLYHRLVSLTKSEEKRYFIFFNEFRQETHILRQDRETINDRNDRAVRKAVEWYSSHLDECHISSATVPAVIMVSNDKENLRKAKEEGLQAYSLQDYISLLPNATALLDIITDTSKDRDFKSTFLYPEYISLSKMRTGVNAGTLHQGIFNVSTYNYLEGSIHVPSFEKSLVIMGRENINRAISGDQVVIEVLPKDQWKRPSSQIVDEETLDKDDNADADSGEAIISEKERRLLNSEVKMIHGSNSEGKPQPTARVVGIIKRNWRQYVGHIDRDSLRSHDPLSRVQQTVFLVPMDKRIPRIRIRSRQAGEMVGKRIICTIDAWERDSKYPVGHFVRSLGELETKEAETQALLLEYDVQFRPFPKTVLDCLPPEGHDWKVPQDKSEPGWSGREDLRELLICSIDPPNCQDIDDALHARPLPNGNFEVGVHIADVSNFVRPNNAMDKEASQRGTTVYLVDKRIDMLPMLLGTDLCSLKPYVERFAFTVLWEMTPDAKIVNARFTKSVIKSREAFEYEQAQLRVDDLSQQDDLTKGMRTLMMLSKKLRQSRMDAGALNLASPEIKVQLESETSDPVDIKQKKQVDTNSLVEEFMLLANVTVAKKVYDTFPQVALLRRHASPPSTNFEDLQNQLKVRKGMTLRVDSSRSVADSLDECVDPNDPYFNTLVRILATRCMMSAEYFCSGAQSYPEFCHYGLAMEIYTHFTSPIRRYSDLVVHRQLAAAIEYEQLDPSLHGKAKLEGVCKNLNVRHRNAQFAGRASVEYYVGQALKGHVVTEEAFVMRIFSNGFVVFVPRFGIEGVIRLRDLATPEPTGVYDEEKYVLSMTGSRELTVGLFDKVQVKIVDMKDTSTEKRTLKFELV